MKSKTYKHIDDCWNAIREAKTIEEVQKLFRTFPRWSGEWDIITENNTYVVINEYEEDNIGWQVDKETLDIEVK